MSCHSDEDDDSIVPAEVSALVGSEFGGTWKDPEVGFIKFAVKRASKQDQTLHMEG